MGAFELIPAIDLLGGRCVRLSQGRYERALALQPGLDRLTWFGRGPHENYPDRKAGAAVGRYSAAVAEMYVPYIVPQEHGNRCDVRWLRLVDAEGAGLRIEFAEPIQFSASHFTTLEIETTW